MCGNTTNHDWGFGPNIPPPRYELTIRCNPSCKITEIVKWINFADLLFPPQMTVVEKKAIFDKMKTSEGYTLITDSFDTSLLRHDYIQFVTKIL